MGIINITSSNERYQGIHEPLIKKCLFDQVQDILHGRTKNVGLKHEFRYRKTIKCLHCRYNLTAERQKGIVYYRCQTKNCPRACVREDAIDQQIQDMLDKLCIPKEEIQILENELDYLQAERFQRREELLRGAELNLANIDTRITRLTDAYIDRLIDKEAFDQRNQKLLQERIAATEALEEIQSQITASDDRTKKFLELIKAISNNNDKVDSNENRDLIKIVTSNFLIDGKKLVFELKNPFHELAFNPDFINGGPYRYRSRTKHTKPRKTTQELFKLIHDNELPDDLGLKAS